jgi:putative ABC transport system permease protein
MSFLLFLAARSAWNRRLTLGMTLIAVALSVTLLLGVERVRHEARNSFAQSVAGTDLVVGARSSPVQLMLYAVFRLGEATHNIRWQATARSPRIRRSPGRFRCRWAIRITAFRSSAPAAAYFEHFGTGIRRPWLFPQASRLPRLFETVLGAEVAERLGYRLGDRIVLNHGMGDVSLAEHTDKPFTVVGILARPERRSTAACISASKRCRPSTSTGRAARRCRGCRFRRIRAQVRPDAEGNHRRPGRTEEPRGGVQGAAPDQRPDPAEPLLAVLPGVALDQLWQVVGFAERTLAGDLGDGRRGRSGRLVAVSSPASANAGGNSPSSARWARALAICCAAERGRAVHHRPRRAARRGRAGPPDGGCWVRSRRRILGWPSGQLDFVR